MSVLQPVAREVIEWDEYIGRLESPGKPLRSGRESVAISTRCISRKARKSEKGDRRFTIDRMLELSARHSVAPVVETFPMSKVNDALEHPLGQDALPDRPQCRFLALLTQPWKHTPPSLPPSGSAQSRSSIGSSWPRSPGPGRISPATSQGL